eukprot:SM000002S05678  [mRNA]  locus=s2:1482080:1485032:+ [translate_table: standard]
MGEPDASAAAAVGPAALARLQPLFLDDARGVLLDGGAGGAVVAPILRVESGADVAAVADLAGGTSGFVVVDAMDWRVKRRALQLQLARRLLGRIQDRPTPIAHSPMIPAENLVAAFQGSGTQILMLTGSATDAQGMLEALEVGTDGTVLRTDDVEQVLALKEYFARKAATEAALLLEVATVVSVEPAGMGDRVCVDLTTLLAPGEGLLVCALLSLPICRSTGPVPEGDWAFLALVGSFARALFLVHSECFECDYVPSRPFRVNAGAVHSYVAGPGGKTKYLSELQSGSSVLVVDAHGRSRIATVGRAKIESRPLMLIEVEDAEKQRHSVMLQNAETVRLVTSGREEHSHQAIATSALKPSDQLVFLRQEGGRHTGISVQEFIIEK